MPTSATEAVDLGWSTTDIRPRQAADALVAPLLSPAARVSAVTELQLPPAAVEGSAAAPASADRASPPSYDDRGRAREAEAAADEPAPPSTDDHGSAREAEAAAEQASPRSTDDHGWAREAEAAADQGSPRSTDDHGWAREAEATADHASPRSTGYHGWAREAEAAAEPVSPPSSDDDDWAREAEALASVQPTRAALLHSFRARIALDVDGDARAAERVLARAAELAPDARFVAFTRRWIAERGVDPAAIAAAARAEMPLAGDAPERALLLWQIASIEQYAAGQPEAAGRVLRDLAALDPRDPGAHLALAALAVQQGHWLAAAEGWETAAARTDDRAARAALHTAAAGARECFLADPGGARAALERAAEADPSCPTTQAALESFHLGARSWNDYAGLLIAEAERVGEREPGLAYHERAGDVLWECLGDGPAAGVCYQRAAAIAPDDVVARGKLAALYEQEGRHAGLAAVYEELAGRTADPTRRAGILLRLGTLYESRLDLPDDALRSYEGALEAAPALAAAAQALAAHYQAERRWNELHALLLVEADRLTLPVQRAARYAAIAEMREAQVGLTADVIALYERAFAIDPGQSAALDALDRIYRATERWPALVALHEEQLVRARDPLRIHALRLALAALYQERLAAPEKAVLHLRGVLAGKSEGGGEAAAHKQDFAALAALARALAEAGQWAEHVDVLERQAAMLREAEDAIATLYRAATVIESRLDDPRRALSAYERVLERAPGHALALEAVLRLHRGQSRWEELMATERRLLASTERAEEGAAILCRIGQIAEERLGRTDEAHAAYEEALSRVPSHRVARVGLERLLRGRRQFGRLAELLEQQASAESGDPIGRARLLCQAAMLREFHPEEAAIAAPGEEPANGAKRTNGTKPDELAKLAELPAHAELATPAELANLPEFASAELANPAHHGPPAELAGSAELANPAHHGPPAELAGSAELANPAHHGPPADLAGSAELANPAHRGPPAELAGSAELANPADNPRPAELLKPAEFPSATELAKPAGPVKPADSAQPPAAAAGRPGRARSSAPGREPPHLAAAGALCERALSICPGFPTALWGLFRIGVQCGDWVAAAEALEALARGSADPLARSRLLIGLARLVELRLGQRGRAAELYSEAIEVRPDPAAVFDRLRVALGEKDSEASDWLQHAAAATADRHLAAALLRLRAAAIEYSGGRGQAAAAAYELALRRGADSRALEGLARNLQSGDGDSSLPAALFERARLLRDAPARGLLLCVAGALFERAGALAEAESAYEEALAAVPDLLPALGRRKRLREQDGDWAAAAALSAEIGALARDPEIRVKMFEEAALLCLDRLGNLAAAAYHYRAVLAVRPGHRAALDRTLEIAEQTGDWTGAAAVLSEQVEAIGDASAAAELLGLRAHILAERLGDAQAAIADLERAARLRPETPERMRLLAELHEAAGHWADAALAYERQVRAAPDAGSARAARLAQVRIWTEAVPDHARAQRILEQVIELDPDDRESLARLAEVARRAGDGVRAAEVYGRLATESGTPEQRAAVLLNLADLERELGHPTANDRAAAAFDLVAESPGLVGLLEDHHRARQDMARYAALAEAALERMALPAAGALPLRVSLARALGRELGSEERAFEHLQQASRSHPRSALPRLAVAELLVERDPDGAVAELRRVVELDPTEAAAYRGLARLCRARRWEASAALMATAASLVGGEELPADLEPDLAVLSRPAPGALPPDDALRFLVGPSQAGPVRQILAQLDPYLPAIFPDGQELVRMLDQLPDAEPAAGLARSIALALAFPAVDIHRADPGDPLLLLSDPRALALGPDHLADLARTAFDAASALSRLAAGSAVGHVLEPERVQALLRAASDPDAGEPVHRELRKRLASAMPRRARKELEQSASGTGVIDQRQWAVWEQEERRRARRAGVVFARDLRAVAASLVPEAAAAPTLERRRALLASSDAMLDALRFAASEPCWSLCRRLFRARP